MYLRETRQKRADGSLVIHLQLAESVWNPHKKRSEVRIVHNCGRAEDPQTAERLRNLARSILKKCDPEAIVQHSEEWRLVDAWPYGPLYVLEALWQRLGIADIVADQLKGRKLDFPVERALFAMVANRCGPQLLHIRAVKGFPRLHPHGRMSFKALDISPLSRDNKSRGLQGLRGTHHHAENLRSISRYLPTGIDATLTHRRCHLVPWTLPPTQSSTGSGKSLSA